MQDENSLWLCFKKYVSNLICCHLHLDFYIFDVQKFPYLSKYKYQQSWLKQTSHSLLPAAIEQTNTTSNITKKLKIEIIIWVKTNITIHVISGNRTAKELVQCMRGGDCEKVNTNFSFFRTLCKCVASWRQRWRWWYRCPMDIVHVDGSGRSLTNKIQLRIFLK